MPAEAANCTLEVYWSNTRFAGWFDLHSAEANGLDPFGANGSVSYCPTNLGILTQRQVRDEIPALRRPLVVPLGEGGANASSSGQARAPRACGAATFSGRWLDDEWAPFGCYLLRFDSRLFERCGDSRPFRLHLFGDSVMRGPFFDLAGAVLGGFLG